MADPKPRLALVDRAIQEQPEDSQAKNEALRRILTKHTPTIAKLVRADVTAEIMQRLGVQRLEEASHIARLTAERDARPTRSEEAKHVRGALGWGALWGALGGFALAAIAFTLLIEANTRMAFERAQEATQQGALVGAAAANQDPAARGRDVPHLSAP